MSFDDLVEAWLEGERPVVPEEYRDDLANALAGFDALQLALAENVYDAAHDDRPPPRLPDDYELIAEVGRGGMGVVYRARQRSLERDVAIKVLRPGEATYGPILARFADEARHLARLRHPHIVAIHEFGEADGEPYFTMDYVAGEPLSNRLRRGALSPSQAIGIAEQACEAVQFAHEHGVIHRDLKPGNILLDESGHVYVTDFGLARDLAQPATVTRSGELLGTPAYMAREQALGQSDAIGETTDVYGLGVVLYEMLAGKPPFGTDAPAKVLARVIHEEAPPLRTLDRRIPRDLETVVQKALAPQPHRRYPTVKALLEDLRRARDGQPVLARRPGVLLRSATWLRRRAKVVAAVLVTAALVGGATWLLRPDRIDLRKRAEQYAAAGEHEQAVLTWSEYLEDPDAEGRDEALAAAIRSCRAIADRKRAVDRCISLLPFDRDATFGELDFPVGMELLARARAAESSDEGAALRALARHRLEALAGRTELSPSQATQVGLGLRWLADVEGEAAPVLARPARLDPHLQPEGWRDDTSDEELLAVIRDPAGTRWNRARAAHALAWRREGAGEREQAATAYREALSLLRPEFPIYATSDSNAYQELERTMDEPGTANQPGARAVVGFLRGFFDTSSDPRRWLLVQIAAGLQRCAPGQGSFRGRLTFAVRGAQLPPTSRVTLSLRLTPVEEDESVGAFVHVGIPANGRGWLGVLDGRYRLHISTINAADPTEQGRRLLHRIVFDSSSLPETVDVQGQTVELPPIRARLRHELELREPLPGARIDPDSVVFAWAPVPGAAYYELRFDKKVTSFRFGSLVQTHRTTATSVRLADVPELLEKVVEDQLDQWTVEAFDADGVSIGITRKEDMERPFRL